MRKPEPIAPPEAGPTGGDDWFDHGADGDGLEQFPSIDEEVRADSRTPAEGRELAREARDRAAQRRLDGSARVDPDGVPFESLLERQPQKSKALRKATPLLDAVRDAAGIGRERLSGGASALRSGGRKLKGAPRALRTPAAKPGRTPGRRNGAPQVEDPATDQGSPQRGRGNGRPPKLPRIASRRPRRPKPGRIKRLRLLIVFSGLVLLAVISTFFGMMMAISRSLPALEAEKFFAVAKKTEVFDNGGEKMGTLLNNNQQILISSEDISPYMKQAVVAIEDQRFYEHRGVDYIGIGRAALADLKPGGSTQGGSTITQQFVKNALDAQDSRTVLQKFREAATAYHLERQWDKDKILTSYLNTIYFGESAYGIEAAARTYFGSKYPGCGTETTSCASELEAHEAAMLAGIITSPSAFSPRTNPDAAKGRRNLVLEKMKEQGVLSEEQYAEAARLSVPAASTIKKPTEDSAAPYFTSWLRQIVVDRYGPGLAFGGGLQIRTTLDLDMQGTVEQIAYDSLAGIEPTASVVVLDNKTGEIRAMVGGNDFEEAPFNLATQGSRQPGSTFKPFIYATALSNGFSPSKVYSSQEKVFNIPGINPKKERFPVKNYEDTYYGALDLNTALKYSDNSVYAELGRDVGYKKIARMARRMGIQSKVTDNPAMTLGALGDPKTNSYCCTPLEMTHAFLTFAADGKRVGGKLDTIPGNNKDNPLEQGPVPIKKVLNSQGDVIAENEPTRSEVISEDVAQQARSAMSGVVGSGGTGRLAAVSGHDTWGKTGTTEDYGDAWFCGGTENFTACVWVGYPNKVVPMQTEYGGEPVAGGTYPALIWSRVMAAVEGIFATYGDDDEDGEGSGTYVAPSGAPDDSSGSSSSGGGGGGGNGGGGNGGGGPSSAPQPAAPPPSSGGGAPSGGGVGL